MSHASVQSTSAIVHVLHDHAPFGLVCGGIHDVSQVDVAPLGSG